AAERFAVVALTNSSRGSALKHEIVEAIFNERLGQRPADHHQETDGNVDPRLVGRYTNYSRDCLVTDDGELQFTLMLNDEGQPMKFGPYPLRPLTEDGFLFHFPLMDEDL